MEAVYAWVKHIIYYMIFLAVVNNLLADSKYEKYIRFFAGMVLILLVASPLTGKLRLNQQISSMFRSISLSNDAGDLKSELWSMDDRRLNQIMSRYEEAVEQDVAAMAEADGLSCVSVQAQIDGDRDSGTYGQVTDIRLEVQNVRDQAAQRNGYIGSRTVNVDAGNVDSVTIEPVRLGNHAQEDAKAEGDRGKENGLEPADDAKTGDGAGPADDRGAGNGPGIAEAENINHLTGKVAQYYGLEESHIKIQWKND